MSRYKGTNVPKQPTVPPMPKKRRYIDESILVEKVCNGEGLPTISRSVLVNCVLPTIPTADVRENVRGEWIENKKTKQDYQLLFYKVLTCSQCGNQQIKLKGSNFCPNCGADMRGGKQ